MTVTKGLAAVSPFVFYGYTLAADTPSSPYEIPTVGAVLQYGALGLCAIFVLWLCYTFNKMMHEHRKERAELVAALKEESEMRQQNARMVVDALTRVTAALHERPCLVHSSAFNLDSRDSIVSKHGDASRGER